MNTPHCPTWQGSHELHGHIDGDNIFIEESS